MAQATDPTASQQQAGVAAPLSTPNDLGANATARISAALNGLLVDAFALYLKTKNFHWHVSGPHFRDYHLLFEEQADQILASTGVLAELQEDNGAFAARLREAHGLCEELCDVASVSVLEPFIDEAERRRWFLFETARAGHRG